MIPVSEPLLGEMELKNVEECVRTGWVSSSGRFLRRFEEEWAAYCGRSYGVAVSSGTAALQLALAAARGPGSEVIMPAFTIISCALAAVYNGYKPVLVDCDRETWCLDAAEVVARCTSSTRAIMPVAIYGHPPDMDPILDVADDNGIPVIEDAAEAHGAEYLSRRDTPEAAWRRAGSLGNLSCFSFYANKVITTGEGGMVLTDDRDASEKIKSLRNLCFHPTQRFLHEELGFNMRMTNLQAALGVGQISRMAELIRQKRWIAAQYTERLREIECLTLPPEKEWARSIFWMYGVVIDAATGRDAASVMQRLHEDGVETRPFFLGLHEQPALRALGLFAGDSHPVTEHLSKHGFYLPSGLTLTIDQIDQVCEKIRGVLR